MVYAKKISPTVRGQITIPKSLRQELGITPQTKLKIYVENNRIIIEPVSPLGLLFEDLEQEARTRDYTEEDLSREIEALREKMNKELYR